MFICAAAPARMAVSGRYRTHGDGNRGGQAADGSGLPSGCPPGREHSRVLDTCLWWPEGTHFPFQSEPTFPTLLRRRVHWIEVQRVPTVSRPSGASPFNW